MFISIFCRYEQIFAMSEIKESLTGDGPEDVRDEDLHQALVQAVVTVAAPAQHWVILAQQHQTALGETLL